MKKHFYIAFALMLVWTSMSATSSMQMESLSRGLIAMPAANEGIFISWRLLGTDPIKSTTFDLIRDGEVIVKNICGRTNFTDPNGSYTSEYQVITKVNGIETEKSDVIKPWKKTYKVLQLDRPASGMDDVTGANYTYTPNDCSVGDVDGDGEYEIIVQWQPSNKTDNGNEGKHPGNEYIDCYRLNGEKVWRIDMGVNILAGDHHTQFLVYDFDLDGKSELIMRTAPGGKDGQGNYVNQVADDDEIKSADNQKDWRASGSAALIGGQEYLTVFEGATGKAIHTIFYNPNRDAGYGGAASGTVFNWDNRTGKKDYVASYGNRGNRFLAAVAYLDGADKRPSAVMCRGYYTQAFVWAVDFDGKKLTHKWLHASVSRTQVEVTNANWSKSVRTYSSNTFGTSDSYTAFGQGNHNLSVADVDNDGCDEIIYGAATIDHDGWLLYSTGLWHGDALHVADIIPNRPGYEVFRCCESFPYGIEMHDARTGEKIFHQTAGKDTGRGIAADIMAEYEGFEFWGGQGNAPRESASGEFNTVISNTPSINFRIYWDGDLQDELFDGSLNTTTGVASPNIQDWNGTNFTKISAEDNNSQTCNWTKATPCLQADILGDWREELIMWNLDNPSQLNILSSNLPSNYRVPTLMHDHNYRLSIAWQNVSYNQPPHLGYYLANTDFSADENIVDKTALLYYDFEDGDATDYWKRGNGSLVTPSFEGSTGQAASIVNSSDRADFFLTPVDLNNVSRYYIDLDLAIMRGSKTAYFTVMSQSAPDEVNNNWGWFWTTTSSEVHNPYLFELTIPAGTTATVNEQIIAGETGRDNNGVWDFTSGHWYHLTLDIDVPNTIVNYYITDKSNGDEVLKGVHQLRPGESPLIKGIYERNNRYQWEPGSIMIDNVTISKNSVSEELLAITEGDDFVATGTYASATYTRDLNVGEFATICLPFTPDEESLKKFTFYTLDSATDDALYFTEEANPVANTPYIYCLASHVDENEVVTTITGGETVVSQILYEVVVGNWSMKGSFTNQSLNCATDGDNKYYGYIAEDNKLVRANHTLIVKPYRAYFTISATATANVRLYIKSKTGDEVTEISIPTLITQPSTAIYDISGRLLKDKPIPGIYITNGRKTIIK